MNPQIIFGIFSLLLILLALAFLLPPLLRKPTDVVDDRRELNIRITRHQLAELEAEYKEGKIEAEAYQTAKGELEDALYDDLSDAEDTNNPASVQKASKLSALLVTLMVPALVLGFYLQYGQPEAISESSVERGQSAANSNKPKMSMEEMIVKLEKKLHSEPENFTGWAMLGRSYMVLEQPDKAVQAYRKALQLKPEDPTTLLQMADALGTSKSGVLTGEPEQFILKALEKDPENLMGLWLAGMSAKQRGANAEAVSYWEKVLPRLDPDAPERKEVLQLIKSAGGRATDGNEKNDSLAVTQGVKQQTTVTQTAQVSQSISLTIDLADDLRTKVNPEHTLFIYAKAVSGPPMPLAAVRKQVKDLPVSVQLDDSMAMMPQLKLSSFPEVTVGARISVNGTPTKSAGDLFVEHSPVKAGQSITLTINQVVE